MGRIKGQKQNEWCVYKKKYEGELYEKNEYRYPLPPVGSYVVVWRRRDNFKKGYGADGTVLGVYNLDDNCLDALNRPLVYKVVEYKLGSDKENAVKMQNSVYLESAGLGRGYTYKKWIDTVSITNGYYYLEIQESSKPIYDSQDVFNPNSAKCPVAEQIPSIEKAKKNPKR